MKLKGAFFPEIRKVASEKLQIELGCSPEVARVFHPSMVIAKLPETMTYWTDEVTLEKWEELAGQWEVDEMNSPVSDLGLDQVYLH